MFSKYCHNIALIRKNKPKWQAGKLNGIGGKVEFGETPTVAMVREFKEETGMDTTIGQWTPFLFQQGSNFTNEVFYTRGDLDQLQNITDEKIVIRDICNINLFDKDLLHNVNWMIALAIDSMRNEGPNYISVGYT